MDHRRNIALKARTHGLPVALADRRLVRVRARRPRRVLLPRVRNVRAAGRGR